MSDLTFTGAAHIKSSWQGEKKTHTVATATDHIASLEDEMQTVESALQNDENHDVNERGTMSVATDWAPRSQPAGSGWVYPGPHHDDDTVAAFLREVQDETLEDLHINAKSSAFDSYDPNWQQRTDGVEMVHTYYPGFAMEQEWHAIGLSWNSTGTLLAVCYGRIDTVAWCHDKGHIAVWQIGQEDETRPYASFDTDSYVTSVAFHPSDPSMLAAGAYNGDILLLNVSEPDAAPRSSAGSKEGSREPVLRLQWLQNPGEQNPKLFYVLCSSSADGKVLFWVAANNFEDPISGYVVHNKKGALVGVQSMSFVTGGASARKVTQPGRRHVPAVKNVMLLGVESGDVFRTKPIVRSAANVAELPKLEVDDFEAHLGPVHSVDSSPFFRNLFLTASSDGSVRLYTTLEKKQLAAVDPTMESTHYVYGAQFSLSRAAVFAAVSRNGNLYLYDVQQSRTKPAVAVEAGMDGTPVLSLAFNHADPSLLVTGDARGAVRIWKLSAQLQEPTDLERAAVRQSETHAPTTTAAADEPGAADAGAAATSAVRQLFGFPL